MAERKILTADAGAPVADNQQSQTAGPGGPVVPLFRVPTPQMEDEARWPKRA